MSLTNKNNVGWKFFFIVNFRTLVCDYMFESLYILKLVQALYNICTPTTWEPTFFKFDMVKKKDVFGANRKDEKGGKEE